MPVIILRGVPYSGKSYHARQLQAYPSLIFSADDFHRTPDGRYDFKVENAAEAHLWCFKRFTEAAQRKLSDTLVVDNTNIKLWEVSPYLMVARSYGHAVTVLTITCPLDELLRRREARPEQVIPLDVIERMLKTFEPSLTSWETFETQAAKDAAVRTPSGQR